MTITDTPVTTRGSGSNRILAVTRLIFINRWTVIGLPWLILAMIFLVNLTIWFIIDNATVSSADRADAVEGTSWSGASFYLFVYMLIVAVQAINQTFPFAQGYGVTRTHFYLGASTAFVLLSAMYAVGFTLLGVIEEVTGGWGLGGHMFTAVYFGDGWSQRLFIVFVGFLFSFFLGAVTAAIYVRFRRYGMYVFFAALTVAMLGGAVLVTTTNAWPAIGSWFLAVGPTGVAMWLLPPTAVSAIAGYRVLQGATPQN